MKPEKLVTATQFKARCLSLLESVRRTRQPLLVTRRGKPIAKISPPSACTAALYALKGSVLRQKDLVSPLPGAWDSAN